MLAIDADGDGQITRREEIVFTAWAPGAGSDMEALRAAFDSNGDGRLDAGDARFQDFRILVDGQTKTSAELGIVSIDLVTKASPRAYADGSALEGRASFTRTDGSAGAAFDAHLAYDAQGVRSVVTPRADALGRSVRTQEAYDTDGHLLSRAVATTTLDGSQVNTDYDDDGDGAVDRRQSMTTRVVGGVTTTVQRDYDRSGTLVSSVSTSRSQGGRLEIVDIDADGNGLVDQTQRFAIEAGGRTVTDIASLRPNGTLSGATQSEVSADGATRLATEDPTGAGVVTRTRVVTSTAANGERTQATTVSNHDGSLRAGETKVTSGDGRGRSVASDLDGDGLADRTVTTQVTQAAAGVTSETTTLARDGATVLAHRKTLTSPDGRVTTTELSEGGGTRVTATVVETVSVAADGARTQTTETHNADGSLRSLAIEARSADGRTGRSTLTLPNGAGGSYLASEEATEIAAGGVVRTTTRAFNPDGTLRSSTIKDAGVDGRSWTRRIDADGLGGAETEASHTVRTNTDGSLAAIDQTVGRDAAQTPLARRETTTSADRLTTTVVDHAGGTVAAITTVTDAALPDGRTSTCPRRRAPMAGASPVRAPRSVPTSSPSRPWRTLTATSWTTTRPRRSPAATAAVRARTSAAARTGPCWVGS